MWRPDVDHLFYRRTEDHRQDHPPSRPNLTLLTFETERVRSGPGIDRVGIRPGLGPPPPHQQELLMAAEESGGVFLRAFLVVLCLSEGRIYLELDGLEISGNFLSLFESLTTSVSV